MYVCTIFISLMFFIFGCWLLPEKFSFCPKNSGFVQVRGAAIPQPLAHMPMTVWEGECPTLVLMTVCGLCSYEAKFEELDAKNQQFQEEFRQKSNEQHNTITLYTKTLEQRGMYIVALHAPSAREL